MANASTLMGGVASMCRLAPGMRAKPSQRQVAAYASSAKFFVGGNWKMNGDKASVSELVSNLNAGSVPANIDIVCAPPFPFLSQVLGTLDASKFAVAAQNCWSEGNGAFTGEVSADMLADLSVPWVILGHSERRLIVGESNEVVGAKVKYALSKGLKVLPCIGETLEQREAGELWNVLDAQMRAIVSNIETNQWSDVVIAYEPVWAIGTGVVASPEQAQEVHAWLRKWMIDNVGAEIADTTRILYGGSVKGANAAELGGQEDVDGFLVGGASLDAKEFITICNAAQ
ncbi:unnamed protein product [Pedinophyceae sp. YPF-701]|nr:unnamed protein product [Pedinophyceae sp. YPF-701]